MPVNTGAKTRISIGPRLSAKLPTDKAAALTLLKAITYVKVGEVESIGDYGDTINDVTFASLDSGRSEHLKGLADAGTTDLTIGFDKADTGQLALVDAFYDRSRFDYPFKVEYVDGQVDYFAAKVMGNKKTGITTGDVIKRAVTLGINSDIIDDDVE
ncbi:phage tail tube protein [Pseudomonas sp. NPDC088368]|jgi:hypothetical protein|uniref:phage tail tube protein n=1 Tax=Pseudomonas sp. NPDC088368 TaxID=3364453 RepID=UPI0037FE4C89